MLEATLARDYIDTGLLPLISTTAHFIMGKTTAARDRLLSFVGRSVMGCGQQYMTTAEYVCSDKKGRVINSCRKMQARRQVWEVD